MTTGKSVPSLARDSGTLTSPDVWRPRDFRALLQDAFFKPIYDAGDNRLVLKTSRQSTKTTLLRNKLTLRSLYRPGNAALYVAPTGHQVSDFSKKKLDTVFSHNPALKKYQKGGDWNVTFKQFMLKNGISTINLRSTGGAQGAEGVRGGTYNDIFKDEYQSLIEEHLPVIDECAATFQGPDAPYQAYFCNTGTPLGFENPIEREWNQSRKAGSGTSAARTAAGSWSPWACTTSTPTAITSGVRTGCGRNVYRKKGTPRKFDPEAYDYQCPRIPPEGKWFATNPKGKFPGFRVVRMMMPWSVWRSDSGTGILDRLETWPERKFQNEVMGLPFDGGSQPFSESTLRACCTSPDRLPRTVSEEEMIAQKYLQYPKVAGLDWAGTGDESVAAYTTYGVFAVVNGRLRLIYAHKFVGLGSSDPDFILRHIVERMNRFQINLLMADYGMGHWEDRRLMQLFPGRVAISHYTGSGTMSRTKFDPVSQKFIVPKTATMQNLEVAAKNQQLEFPEWEDCQEYLKDLQRGWGSVCYARKPHQNPRRRRHGRPPCPVRVSPARARPLPTPHDAAPAYA